MNKKTINIIIGLVLLLAYYSALFYIAQRWYRAAPGQEEQVLDSSFVMAMLYSAWVMVPLHFAIVLYLAYKRKINIGELFMCLLMPIALAALFFPAKA